MDTDEKKQEEAQKKLIIERIIILLENGLDCPCANKLWSKTRKDLSTINSPKLAKLEQEVEQAKPSRELMDLVAKAVCDFRQAQRAEDDKRLDDGSGPAKAEVEIY